MWNRKLCKRLFESSHDFAARTVLKAVWVGCGILTFILWMPNSAKAALPQWERVEPRRTEMERQRRILEDRKWMSGAERERVLGEVRKRFDAEGRETEILQPHATLFEPKPFRPHGLVTLHDLATQKNSQEYLQWVQKSLQQALRIPVTLDGLETPTGKEAIRSFQKWYGLVPDGIIGPKTENKLAEVTGTKPPARWSLRPLAHWDLRKLLEENKSAEETPPPTDRKRVFLDVRKDKGRFSVTARRDGDLWLEEAGLPELGNGTKHEVSSLDEFEKVLGDANTVVHQGDDLPKEWRDHLQENRDYLRHSWRSRRQGLGEYVRAVELLDRKAELGKTRIFNALPQAREETALRREMRRMRRDPSELEGWQQVRRGLDAVEAESGFSIETGTKEAFLEELQEGTNDTIVLIAHSEDGAVHFPSGETLSIEELSALHREIAPDRSLILNTCEAGIVNKPMQSLSETLLGGNLGLNVIAHPKPLSGADVPAILREFLVDGKSIKEVFVRRGYLPISENLEHELSGGKANVAVVADLRLMTSAGLM